MATCIVEVWKRIEHLICIRQRIAKKMYLFWFFFLPKRFFYTRNHLIDFRNIDDRVVRNKSNSSGRSDDIFFLLFFFSPFFHLFTFLHFSQLIRRNSRTLLTIIFGILFLSSFLVCHKIDSLFSQYVRSHMYLIIILVNILTSVSIFFLL